MIGKTVSNILTSNSRFLYESQDKIIAVAKGRGQEKFGDKVPNITDFKNQLESLRSEITTPENVEKAEKVFNRFLNICDSIINKTQASINELNNIKAKLDKILANFDKLNRLVESLQPIAQALSILIRGANALLLALNNFTGITGLQVKQLSDSIDAAKDKITEFNGQVRGLTKAVPHYENEANKLIAPIDKGIASLTTVIDKITQLKDILIQLYAAFIASLQFPEYDNFSEEELQTEIETELDESSDENNTGGESELTTQLNTQLGTYFVTTIKNGVTIKYEYKKLEV